MYDSPPSIHHHQPQRPKTLETLVRTYQISGGIALFFSAMSGLALLRGGGVAALLTLLAFGLLGALLLALGRGLWDLLPWARWGALALHGLAMIAMAVLFGWVWPVPLLLILGLAINGLVLAYLLGREARSAFGR